MVPGCPEGQERSQSVSSWLFAGGPCAERQKVKKAVILEVSRASVSENPGIPLLLPISSSSAIKSHIDLPLSNLYPFLSVTPHSSRARFLLSS